MQVRYPIETGPATALFREFFERDAAAARLPKSFRYYYLLRKFIPLGLRQMLQRVRNRRVCVADDWYLPHDFIHRLTEAMDDPSNQRVVAWPDEKQFAFVLTHDVETSDGMRNINAIAEIEEEFGFRSSWNIVPHKYPVDPGLLDDLRQRGHEIGVHGYNHDGKLFWSDATFRKRTEYINAALERYDAVGFRAPMAHRNLQWMQQLNIEYDSSCFDIDPFQAMPGGIGSLWPIIAGRFVELPYTLPQDHTLLVSLGETSDRIWRDKLAFIRQHGGMALMLTHPDYLDSPVGREIYRGFLSHVRDRGDFWHVLPRELARWWKNVVYPPGDVGSHSLSATPKARRERSVSLRRHG